MHQIGQREEMLKTRLFKNIVAKQEIHEKLAHTKIEKMEKR